LVRRLREPDRALWHETLPSLSKPWERVFSDIQKQKTCMDPKRDSRGRKCIPDQVSDEVELEPEKKAT
jgi:hypothetical protein